MGIEKIRLLRMKRISLRKLSDDIFAFAAYILFSVVFTYPVAFVKNEIPGEGDVFFCLWELWWFKEAITNRINPYYTKYLFYPKGTNLIFADLSPIIALPSVPLQMAFGLVNTYNIIWLGSFVLSGFGSYLLVKYLTNNKRAAFISGIIFMFCPYHFAHALGHLSLFNMEWLPLYVLYLIKLTREQNIVNSLYAAFFLLLTGMSSNYYLLFLSVFTLMYVAFFLRFDESLVKIEFIKKIGIMGVSFVVMFSPFLYLMLSEILRTKSNYMYAPGFTTYSADVLAFFTPSAFNTVLNGFTSSINSSFTGGGAEYTVFAGYTVLLLSFIAIVKVRSREIVFWALSTLVFFVLSLGPILHFHGIFSVHIEDKPAYVALPYALLMRIPLFSMVRVPSRWDVLIMLCLAILAGYGANYILSSEKFKCLKANSCKNALSFIFISLILFEFLAVPYPTTSAEIPNFYKQIAVDDGDYGILEVPILNHVAEYMYYQTVHDKKLFNGYIARIPDEAQAVFSTPFINQLIYASPYDDIISHDWKREAIPVLKSYKIRYIVVHKDLMYPVNFQFNTALLNSSVGVSPRTYDDGSIFVYRIPDDSNRIPDDDSGNISISLGNGWYGPESWNGTASRWISNNATLIIHSKINHTVNLSLSGLGFQHPKTLEIYANSSLVAKKTVNTNFTNISSRIDLRRGDTVILFHVIDGCDKPCDTSSSADCRCLSLAFQKIQISDLET